jgi:cytochrome P450
MTDLERTETSHAKEEVRVSADAYSLFCNGKLEEPYPLLHELQEQDPVHWSPELSVWIITRYDDVLMGLSDQRFANDRASMNLAPISSDALHTYQPLARHVSNWLGFTDPPKHTRMRQTVAMTINARLGQTLRVRVGDIVCDLLENLAVTDSDLVADFAVRLPTTVICEILGVPTERTAEFKTHCDALLEFAGNLGSALVPAADKALTSLAELTVLFRQLLARRRSQPKQDLLTILVQALDNGVLSDEEVLGLCVFVFVAGFETTVGLLANGLLLLLRHPDQAAQMRAENKTVHSAVEEILRYESPIPVIPRLAASDIELRGHTIKRGDGVAFHIGAANRDERKFPEPDRFDVRRKCGRHLSLGWSAHSCLGGPLARLEGATAFERVLSRFPSFPESTTVLEPPCWRSTIALRCPNALRVRL